MTGVTQLGYLGIGVRDVDEWERFATGVLGDGDDLEISVPQLLVDGLPPGQVESAPSPGGPGDDQHFLAAKVGQVSQYGY